MKGMKQGEQDREEESKEGGNEEGRKQGRKEARTNERNAHLQLKALVQLVLALSPCPITRNNFFLKGGTANAYTNKTNSSLTFPDLFFHLL